MICSGWNHHHQNHAAKTTHSATRQIYLTRCRPSINGARTFGPSVLDGACAGSMVISGVLYLLCIAHLKAKAWRRITHHDCQVRPRWQEAKGVSRLGRIGQQNRRIAESPVADHIWHAATCDPLDSLDHLKNRGTLASSKIDRQRLTRRGGPHIT